MQGESFESFSAELEATSKSYLSQIEKIDNLQDLEALRIDSLGKNSQLSLAMRKLGSFSHEQRQMAGQVLNRIKESLTLGLANRKAYLEDKALEARLASEQVDVTRPPQLFHTGTLHPISKTIEEICNIFAKMGFSVMEGPDIEDDYHNFTALNFPPDHPARQMHDTFYLCDPTAGEGKPVASQNYLLRTHTSPGQVRAMQSMELPIRVIVPGRTFRSDSDITHTPMFHQLEGLVIDKTTNFSHLKGCLKDFCGEFFEISQVPLRFRNSFFPFTEPSAEVDIGYRREGNGIIFGGNEAWMEILGCGMVHPNVLRLSGIDPEVYQGFAFGMGIERLSMLKYGIGDLRTFFDGDIRWQQHYGFSPFTSASGLAGLLKKRNLHEKTVQKGAK